MKRTFLLLSIILSISTFVLGQELLSPDNRSLIRKFIDDAGREVYEIKVPGIPPENFRMPVAFPTRSAVTLPEVPAFDWSFGCSATSAAMMAGYYDRTGYSNVYNGPTNGGLIPLDNSVWGSVTINGEVRKQCPLSATRNGVDGRTTRGHVDDFWVLYNSSAPDPYITNSWNMHTYGECTGDYMGTNQSALSNTDGSTTFYYYGDGSPCINYSAPSGHKDGCRGMREFFESRGYSVINNYTQLIYGYNGNTLGFTFAQYIQEINAGRPVLIQVNGHTMLGYGYDQSTNHVYLHDTWDYSDHTMTWGGSYSGLQQWGVSVVQVQPISGPCLSVTPLNRNVPSTAGVTSYSVSNTCSGTMTYSAQVTSGSDWLTITSGGTGGNSGTINVSYSANTGTTQRIGTITVTAPGATGSPVQVTVTQPAPIPGSGVLTIGTIMHMPPGSVVLPVHATNVVNMGSFQFSIEYDVTKLAFISCSDWYTGITAVSVGEPMPGHITFVWAGDTGGINIADGTIFNINFNHTSGSSAVIWSDNPTPREFSDWDGTIFIPTNNDGAVNADVTPPILTVSPLNQNVTSANGTTSFTVSNSGGGTMTYSAQVTSGSNWLTITSGGSGGNSGTINVSYTANAGATQRVGTITVTAPGATGSPVQVTVTQQGSYRNAPVTTCASKGAPDNTSVSVPITVTNFDSITSLSLRLDYDPTLLIYTGNTNPNPVLTGLIVNDNHVSATLHKVLMIWTDISQKTLPANSKITDLNFTHISGTTVLNWNNDANGGADCEYADKNGDPLYDLPTSQFYINGDVHLQQGFKVSGNFIYNNSTITVLDNVKVYLKLNTVKIDSVLTNGSGYFEFPIVQNNTYTLDGITTKPWGGVNGTDALKIQRHFAGLELITEPVRLQAADVNLSYSINGTDALKVKRRFAGLDFSFMRGDWTFAKQTIGGDEVIVNGADVTANFFGLCVGDVNGSNTPSPGKSLNSLINLELNGTMEAALDKEFELPVKIMQDAQLGAISLVLAYPEEYLTFVDLKIGDKSLSKYVNGNQIRVAWAEIDPMTLGKNEVLLLIRFKLSKPVDNVQSLSLSLGNESELADSWANPIVCTLSAPSIVPSKLNGINDPTSSLQNCTIYPNPAKENLTIEFELVAGSAIQICLIDLTGRQIAMLFSEELQKGNFKRTFTLKAVPQGVYTLKISSTGDKTWRYYKKLIISSK